MKCMIQGNVLICTESKNVGVTQEAPGGGKVLEGLMIGGLGLEYQ